MGTVSYKLMHHIIGRELQKGFESRYEKYQKNVATLDPNSPNFLTLIEVLKEHTVEDCMKFRTFILDKYKEELSDYSCTDHNCEK